jgi:hypothetical protein
MEKVLSDPEEDRLGTDGARIVPGRTEAGRYLRVIYVPDRRCLGRLANRPTAVILRYRRPRCGYGKSTAIAVRSHRRVGRLMLAGTGSQ